jgi:hypothetical protein
MNENYCDPWHPGTASRHEVLDCLLRQPACLSLREPKHNHTKIPYYDLYVHAQHH